MIQFNSNYPNQLQDQVTSVSLKSFGYTRSSYISSKKKRKEKELDIFEYTLLSIFLKHSLFFLCVLKYLVLKKKKKIQDQVVFTLYK